MKTPPRPWQEAGEPPDGRVFGLRPAHLEGQLLRFWPAGIPVGLGLLAMAGKWMLGIAIVAAIVVLVPLLRIDRTRLADWLDGLIGIRKRQE